VSRELVIAVVDYESFRIALIESPRSLGYRACGFPSAEEIRAGDGEGSVAGDLGISEIRAKRPR
jgi:hypothetical protein